MTNVFLFHVPQVELQVGELRIDPEVSLMTKERAVECLKDANVLSEWIDLFETGRMKDGDNLTALGVIPGRGSTFLVFRDNRDDVSDWIVQEKLNFFALSQVGYRGRATRAFVSNFGARSLAKRFSTGENINIRLTVGNQAAAPRLAIDDVWKNWQEKNGYWFDLIKQLNPRKNGVPKKEEWASKWRDRLRRAGIFLGKSFNSSVRSDALLWNMVAIEIILVARGKDTREQLKTNVGLFFRADDEKRVEIEEGLQRCYDLRNDFVHKGLVNRIETKDVILTDYILFNLFYNIARNPTDFSSAEAISSFAEKVEAANILGIRPEDHVPMLKIVSLPDYEKVDSLKQEVFDH